MEELKDILSKRLLETFKGETQQVTAGKLAIEQGTVSKWVTGNAMPGADTLLLIAKKYRVSVDWLLGLSEEKEVDAVNINNLTYEQISLVVHRLIELGSIEIPDLAQFDTEFSEDEGEETRNPRFDPDYIKINDRALSFILRTRWKLREIDDDTMDFWIDNYVKRFNGVRLLKNDEKTRAALDAKPWSTFKAGDWASLLNDMGKEAKEKIDNPVKKEKEVKSYGR